MPWAAVLALVVLGMLDVALLGARGPWTAITDRLAPDRWLERGVASDNVALARMRALPPGAHHVYVMGSSRAQFGFGRGRAEAARPDVQFGLLAHAEVGPFALRSLAEAARSTDPDAVVIVLSEYDTHRPVRLQPSPGLAGASPRALVDLVAAAGPGFALRHRGELLAVAASSGLRAYRYRVLLGAAGLDAWRKFLTEPRLLRRRHDPIPPAALGAGRTFVSDEVRLSVLEPFPPGLHIWIGTQMQKIREIRAGPHVAVNEMLLRRAVARLRDAGVDVVVVELPLHPAAAPLYDPQRRAEFLAFARELEAELGARLVVREHMPAFTADDFTDLSHPSQAGNRKLTDGMLQGLGVR